MMQIGVGEYDILVEHKSTSVENVLSIFPYHIWMHETWGTFHIY